MIPAFSAGIREHQGGHAVDSTQRIREPGSEDGERNDLQLQSARAVQLPQEHPESVLLLIHHHRVG